MLLPAIWRKFFILLFVSYHTSSPSGNLVSSTSDVELDHLYFHCDHSKLKLLPFLPCSIAIAFQLVYSLLPLTLCVLCITHECFSSFLVTSLLKTCKSFPQSPLHELQGTHCIICPHCLLAQCLSTLPIAHPASASLLLFVAFHFFTLLRASSSKYL